MSGDGYSSKGRPALGDVTNRPVKRAFPANLDDADSKRRDVKGKGTILEDGEYLIGKDGDVGVEKIVSFLKGRGDLEVSSKGFGAQVARDDLTGSISELNQSLEERVAPVPVPVEENLVPGDSASEAPIETDKDIGIGKLTSNKFGSIEWSRLPSNTQAGSFELERCRLLKDSDTSNVCQGTDPISGCSCNFCMKAAFILSDLHYQDIKGRVTAVRKSQKDASTLVQKFGKGKEMEAFISRRSKPSELESSLLNQWKSLFLHMDGVLAREYSQLQSNYLAMKDLRETCKMDLEAINGMPLNKD